MERSRWWTIPAGFAVLLVVLGGAGVPARPAAEAPAVTAAPHGGGERVVIRDASGRRTAPVPLPTAALVVALPHATAGETVQVTLFRLDAAGRRGAEPWLAAWPRVGAAGELSLAGLPSGRYDLEVVTGAGPTAVTHRAAAVATPGRCSFAE